MHINAATEFLPALDRALGSDGVTVITAPVDYSEKLGLTNRLDALRLPGCRSTVKTFMSDLKRGRS